MDDLTHYRCVIVGPEGPVRRQWFDECGNHHTLYENGAESILTAELLADAMDDEVREQADS